MSKHVDYYRRTLIGKELIKLDLLQGFHVNKTICYSYIFYLEFINDWSLTYNVNLKPVNINMFWKHLLFLQDRESKIN